MRRLLIIFLLGLMGCQIIFAMQQTNFDRASAEYKDANKGTINKDLSGKVNASDYSKSDINSSDAERYYEDETAMDKAKQNQFANNPSAHAVHKTSTSNTHEIDPNNPAYKKAVSYQTNAEQILSNEGERYDCQHIQKDGGKKTYIEKCQVSNIVPMQCSRYPTVNTYSTDNYIKSTVALNTGNFRISDSRKATVYTGAAGDVISLHLYISKSRNMSEPCGAVFKSYIDGTYVGMTHVMCDYNARSDVKINLSGFRVKYSPNTHFTFSLLGNGAGLSGARPFGGSATILVNHPVKHAKVTWTDNCQHINKDACVKMSESCVEGKATRNFGGVNVTQDCWKYDYTYKCGYKKHDNCDEIAKRCDFISQKCIEEAHGYCYAYERTYQCSEAQEGSKTLICGNPNTIQFTHSIDKADPADFMKAVSALAGASEMAGDISKAQKDIAMLKGNPTDCGEGAMGVYDCCDGDGNFLHGCSDSEKGLQKARQRKIATFVGRYCGKKVLGVCVAHRQTWCVFESKLARILQEQGRRKQLGISFGSGEHPNCAGIPVNDLQRIDFTKIDFSEFFDEVKSKTTLPDNKTASGMFNKFKDGASTPEMNKKKGGKDE